MIWWDPTELFKRRFEPIEGGYLFYPRHKYGGKLLLDTEYEGVIEYYRRWMGTRFVPGLLALILMAGIFAIAVTAAATDMPESIVICLTYVVTATFIASHLWIDSTPYRLFRRRPDSAPPRSKDERARANRAAIPWLFLVWMILIAAIFLYVSVIALIDEPSMASILWAVGCIFLLVQAARIAGKKYRDREDKGER